MRLRVAFFLVIVCLSVVFFSCRRNQPSLIDTNRPPDTELWSAPVDLSEFEWKVHLYWRGIDRDGVAQRFIWTITDTLDMRLVDGRYFFRWNPAERVSDYRSGHVTDRTDTVIAFTAYNIVRGIGLQKNRQAFHVAAIDDNGVIDPEPAAVEFVATVSELPKLRFATTITTIDPLNGDKTVTKPFDPAVFDTVGMFRPLAISYHGFTTNGIITAYRFSPQTGGIVLPGQDIWYADLTDTIRYFPNVGEEALPSGIFKLIAQCRDQSGGESRVDATRLTEGVVQVAINYEPDTEINQVENTYYIAGEKFAEFVDFKDDIPDTVPYSSWVRIDYRGWDDRRDSTLCTDDLNKCVRYQVQYERTSARQAGSNARTLWLPETPTDTNDKGTADSTTVNIGSVEYKIRARAVDEYGKPDLTMFDTKTGEPKSQIEIIGNFDPVLDAANVINYPIWPETNGIIVPDDGDTIVWDWWHPANYKGNESDTLEYDAVNDKYYVNKLFHLDVTASGHDHPKEDVRFGIKDWNYFFIRTDNLEEERFFGGQGAWLAGPGKNVFARRFESIRFRYERDVDPGGASFFEDPPSYWNSEYEFSILGRDIGPGEEFQEYMFVDTASAEPRLLNQYQASPVARWTRTETFRFFLKVAR